MLKRAHNHKLHGSDGTGKYVNYTGAWITWNIYDRHTGIEVIEA